jgi:hypothetical protein
MADEARGFYAVQFHPEVTHTVQGAAAAAPLRARHLRLRAGDWIMGDYVGEAVARIREQVGQRGSDSGPVGRRGFLGGGGADAPRHRRSAHLRVRRPRPAAPERRRPW